MLDYQSMFKEHQEPVSLKQNSHISIHTGETVSFSILT